MFFCESFAASLPLPELLKSHGTVLKERYSYYIDFLFFKRLAEAELSFSATGQTNLYQAELIGRTLGVAAWLTNERTQRYTSLMERLPDGRMRSLIYESQILKKKHNTWKDRRKRYRFDYRSNKIFQEKFREGTHYPGQVYLMPESADPVDMLTALYNVRLGTYGELRTGARLRVPSFSSKGLNEIIIDVLNPEDQSIKRLFPSGGSVLKVWIDPEVFDSSGNAIYVWLNKSGIPEKGVIEDVIGMGDLYGYMRTGSALSFEEALQ
jgi:hypothetical protein